MLKSKTVSFLGEFGLIKHLMGANWNYSDNGILGPGDDCAVIGPECSIANHKTWDVVTVDSMIEGHHFRCDYSSAKDVGWKLVATTLSDIAAMGSVPKYGVLSLGISDSTSVEWVEELYLGIKEASSLYQFKILGGDTVKTTNITLSLTAFGNSNYPPVLRSTAKIDDEIWVSGPIGLSGYGLQLLKSKEDLGKLGPVEKSAVECQLRPVAELELGALLGRQRIANSMIDISDGLVQDLEHLLDSSKVNAKLQSLALEKLVEQGEFCRVSTSEAITFGEDYKLLFTVSHKNSPFIQDLVTTGRYPKLHCIGKIVDGQGAQIVVEMKNGKCEINKFLEQNGVRKGGFSYF